MAETSKIVDVAFDFLPLKTNAFIIEGNALQLDWSTFKVSVDFDYIIGNPPFVGFTYMTQQQKDDMNFIFPGIKNLDYVCAWYKKASDLIQGKNTHCAFVSTNSITQGETVSAFFPQSQEPKATRRMERKRNCGKPGFLRSKK